MFITNNRPFDSLHDCQTMFQLCDLLLETISCQTGKSSSYCWIPSSSEPIRTRESHYWSVILNDYFKSDDAASMIDLLSLHPNFSQPSDDTNWLTLHAPLAGNQEALLLSHGLRKVHPRTLANILVSVAQLDSRKQETAKKAMEVLTLVEFTLQEMISKKAYCLWIQRGSVHGHDQRDWFDAENEIRSKYAL
jgi:Protein of unknown function (DUF2934)